MPTSGYTETFAPDAAFLAILAQAIKLVEQIQHRGDSRGGEGS